MIWDDLAEIGNNVFHILIDIVYSIQYIFDNLSDVFSIIFQPLNFAFNFIKGFFDGISVAPPETAITWTFDTEILDVFNSIPHFSLFMYAIFGGISIIIFSWIVYHLLKI